MNLNGVVLKMINKDNFEVEKEKYYKRKSYVKLLKKLLNRLKIISIVGIIFVSPPFILSSIFDSVKIVQIGCLIYYVVLLITFSCIVED